MSIQLGNKCYKPHYRDFENGATWEEAVFECRGLSEGFLPDLASIHSEQEMGNISICLLLKLAIVVCHKTETVTKGFYPYKGRVTISRKKTLTNSIVNQLKPG